MYKGVLNFLDVTSAFESLYQSVNLSPIAPNGTKAMYDVVFGILEPFPNNKVTTKARKFKVEYAEKEWDWYMSMNPNAIEIGKAAKIWENHMDENGDVQSNYGWQLSRANQIGYIIKELNRDKWSRRAVATIYDGKEWGNYGFDTPCTLSLQFWFHPHSPDKLNLTVHMRSNDLWFGFCNDFYCFSKFQKMIADELNVNVGTYTHFVQNLHLYERHFDKLPKKFR